MRTHRGSIRHLLQRAMLIGGPRDRIYPYNPKWRFDKKRHARLLRFWIDNTREIVDSVEAWLDRHAPLEPKYRCIRCKSTYMEEPDKCHDCSYSSFEKADHE